MQTCDGCKTYANTCWTWVGHKIDVMLTCARCEMNTNMFQTWSTDYIKYSLIVLKNNNTAIMFPHFSLSNLVSNGCFSLFVFLSLLLERALATKNAAVVKMAISFDASFPSLVATPHCTYASHFSYRFLLLLSLLFFFSMSFPGHSCFLHSDMIDMSQCILVKGNVIFIRILHFAK